MSKYCSRTRDHGGKSDRQQVHRFILEAFPRLGRSPSLVEISKHLRDHENVILEHMRDLGAEGALRLDPANTRILDAYPYSAVPTKHTVQLLGGSKLYCMCAIDVFYVPFLTQSDVSIDSRCHHCDSGIHIAVSNESIAGVEPATTVVWDSAACYDCPLTNFFCSDDHLETWLGQSPDEPGKRLSLIMALERGRNAAARIREGVMEAPPTPNQTVKRESTITCPHCQSQRTEIMPLDACVYFYQCIGCGAQLKPQPGDCCVFCSYGSTPCPPIQE